MIDNFKEKLIENIGQSRYNHVERVKDTATELAKIYGADIEEAKIAALLHDCAKYPQGTNLLKIVDEFDIILDDCTIKNHDLIHGPLGAKIAEIEYGVKNRNILEAIYYHTTGKENMNILEKIIYIADYIEPSRNFPGVEEIRKIAFENIDDAIFISINQTIRFLIDRNKLIHPNTIMARNYLMINSNNDK